MTDEEMLAEMRKQYEHATLESHILVDGVLFVRCRICGKNPLPPNFGSVLWCDPCLDEHLEGNEDITTFVERKRNERSL